MFLEFHEFETKYLAGVYKRIELPGVPKKNYTLFDFMYRKIYKSYFTKIKSILFTKD